MNVKFRIHENFDKRPPAQDNHRYWVENCGWHLHSNGKVYLRAPEFFPTREDAEDVLAEFPKAKIPVPQRKWCSGDVFRLSYNSNILMIYISGVQEVGDKVFCLSGPECTMEHNTNEFMRGASFVFNVNDHLKTLAPKGVL